MTHNVATIFIINLDFSWLLSIWSNTELNIEYTKKSINQKQNFSTKIFDIALLFK